MKVPFQVLCSSDYDWDDELTPDLLSWWNRLIADMNALKNIRVPRCYFSWREGDPVGHQLHGFSDASCKAYAAVVYLRTEHANGDIEVNLVASKARVAPIKRQSIPRLELLGATILARLMKTIEKSLVSLRIPPKVYIGQTRLRPFVGFETTRFGNHMCSIESRKYENILIQPIGDLCKEN